MTPRELLAACLDGPYVYDERHMEVTLASDPCRGLARVTYPEEGRMFAAARTGWAAALDTVDVLERQRGELHDEVLRLKSRLLEVESDRDRFRQVAEQAAERAGIADTRRIKADSDLRDTAAALAREVNARDRLETMIEQWLKYRHAPTLFNAYDVYKKGVS